MKTERADALMVARGLCDSREQAKRLILAGEVRCGDRVIDKPSSKLALDTPIDIKERPRFVGRGGFKLEAALDAFQIDPAGWTCIDVGASTGGFTDCLLQRGAARVHAVDVGTNQLVWKLRNDPRVVVREQFNARHMTPEDIGEKVRLAVMDLSFISLTKVLPAVFPLLDEQGAIVCLIKPQFELEREDISKGGIVRDPALHDRAVEKIHRFVTGDLGHGWLGLIPSPITGMDGNREFLACLSPGPAFSGGFLRTGYYGLVEAAAPNQNEPND
ncbi:MAG: TlyA family RNA methyltransferase [Luteolibacter sp.]|jgi:23S rRNA (cytidine1920-2'-O)/16S rRNA (cytidine1409-2'-O)-methyltransferase|nr:TlyA family RNA methyltransferase [Luteolibacter sp.]